MGGSVEQLFLVAIIVFVAVIGLVVVVHQTARNRRVDEELQKLRHELGLLRRATSGAPSAPTTPSQIPTTGAFLEAERELRVAASPSASAEPFLAVEPPQAAPEPPDPPEPPEPSAATGDPPAPRRPARSAAPAGEAPGPRASQPVRSDDRGGLEDFLGGRVLLVVGVVVVLFGLAFFLKWAIDRGWVRPEIRVTAGAVFGLLALYGGDRMRRRGFDMFGHAVMGGGLGAVYLSVFFAAGRYDLIGRHPAFALTAIVTAGGAWLAVRRSAPLLAYLGFLGGFLAPALLSSGRDELALLLAWLVLLYAGVLAVTWRRPWYGLDGLSLVAAAGYGAQWLQKHHTAANDGAAMVLLAILTLSILVLSLGPASLRRQRVHLASLVVALLTGLFAAIGGFTVMYPDHQIALGCALLALAAVYVGSGVRCRSGASQSRQSSESTQATQSTVAGESALFGMAIAAVAAAIPTFLDGALIAPAFSAAGVVAAYLGARHRLPVVLGGGLALIAIGLGDLFVNRQPLHDGVAFPFANGEFFSWASPATALVLAGLIVRWVGDWKRTGSVIAGIGLWLYAPLLAVEILDGFNLRRSQFGPGRAEELGLAGATVALAGYAAAMAWLVRGRSARAHALPRWPLFLCYLSAAALLLATHNAAFTPVLNLVFLAAAVAWASALYVAASQRRGWREFLFFVVIAYGCWALADEMMDDGGVVVLIAGASAEDAELRGLVYWSVSWAIYGGALLAAGFVLSKPGLRWAGLGVFLLTVAKVFLVDLAALPTAYRIGGFMVLGVLLVAASYLYQRARRVAPEIPDESA